MQRQLPLPRRMLPTAVCRPGAFTLLELLIAITISTIVLALLLQFSVVAARTYQSTKERVQAENDAIAALDFIARDIEALQATDTNSESLHIRLQNTDAVDYAAIMFVATVADPVKSPSVGQQVRGVAYRIEYQDPASSTGLKPVYSLYRTTVPATDTFSGMLGKDDLYQAYWQSNGTPSVDDLLAAHVVGLRVTATYIPGPAGPAQTAICSKDELNSIRVSGNRITLGTSPAIAAQMKNVEVSLTVLDEKGGNLLARGEMALADAITRYGHTYTRKIAFYH